MSDLRQFRNLSSWREDTITIGAKEVGTCDFLDTHPNQFAIQNPNNTEIYIAIAKTPNEKNYEHKIGKNANDIFGRPTPTNKIMFFNPSDKDIVLKIYSIFQPFDLMTLKNMTANIEHATVNSDGIVHGFDSNVSIPSGDNLIGRVKVEDAKDYDGKLDALESKLSSLENRFGGMNVNLENMIDKIDDVNTNIGSILPYEFVKSQYLTGYMWQSTASNNFTQKLFDIEKENGYIYYCIVSGYVYPNINGKVFVKIGHNRYNLCNDEILNINGERIPVTYNYMNLSVDTLNGENLVEYDDVDVKCCFELFMEIYRYKI